MRERAAQVAEYSNTTADSGATEALFLQVRTPSELPARGERQRLLNAGLEIVALSAIDPNSATVQLRRSDVTVLQQRVERYATTPSHTGKSYLSAIEDIGPVPIEEKIALEISSDDDTPLDCLLVFYATLTDRERAAVLLAIRSYMSRKNLAIGAERRLSNGVTLVEARLSASDAREVGAAFSTLRQVMPDRLFYVPDGRRISAISPEITIENPRCLTGVAVLDTGISDLCPGVATSVVATMTQLPAGSVGAEMHHGTFVASRILYGDDLESALRSGVLSPLCPLIDIPVIGVDARGSIVPIHEGHLASAIDAALPLLPASARVVNISLGTNSACIDGQMSVVGQILDKHARARDLLVVTTAGNIRNPRLLAGFPGSLLSRDCRIDSPGDALLAVTVGSFAKFDDTGALSRVRQVSAFSRRGPGPFGGLKPELVAHGGNCMADGSTTARVGVHGLAASGNAWECDSGTSFAAPLVSAIAAQLFDHYGNPRANLVRALLLHFTSPVDVPRVSVQSEHLAGLGEPMLDAARWSVDHAASFLHVGELTSSQHQFLPFHVPACLAAGAGGKLKIKVTVVLDPPVSPDNQQEYAKTRVSIALRKPAEIGHHSVSVSNELVEADKWSPISQLTRSFTRSYQTGEWELQLRLWSRGLSVDFRQSFAAIIEVSDETGTLPVRTSAEAEAGQGYRVLGHRAAA
ncbi:hypothetical protein MASR1M101_32790 [Gemmatimonas sp.]